MKILIVLFVCSLAFSAPIMQDEIDVQSTLEDLETLDGKNADSGIVSSGTVQEAKDENVIPLQDYKDYNPFMKSQVQGEADQMETPLVRDPFPIAQADTPFIQDEAPHVENETPFVQDEVSNETPLVEDEGSAVQDESSGSPNDSPLIEGESLPEEILTINEEPANGEDGESDSKQHENGNTTFKNEDAHDAFESFEESQGEGNEFIENISNDELTGPNSSA